MMIRLTNYKDRPAVAVDTGVLTATFLPRDGAKLVSLKTGAGKELLATKPEGTYKVLAYHGSYVDSECSGFDDMFPTVDPETVKSLSYPDHGECCRLPHTCKAEADSVCFTAQSRAFSITYQKTVREKNGNLLLEYHIENHGHEPFPFLWAGHIMLAGEAGAKVLTPFSEDTPTEMMFADPKTVDVSTLPKDRLLEHCPDVGPAYKFYYLAPMPEGVFGIRYGDESALLFRVDPKKLPYLGIWLNNGAFQGGYSITPEPCTVPFDAPNRAAQRGYSTVIPPKDAFSFTIEIQLQGGTQ